MSPFWLQNLEFAPRFLENMWSPEILHRDPKYNIQYISLSTQVRYLVFSVDMLLSCNTPALFNLQRSAAVWFSTKSYYKCFRLY